MIIQSSEVELVCDVMRRLSEISQYEYSTRTDCTVKQTVLR